jgi:hypothetical protein
MGLEQRGDGREGGSKPHRHSTILSKLSTLRPYAIGDLCSVDVIDVVC